MNSRQLKDKRARRAREIQRRINQVLLEDFNPIGFGVPEDEYDCLIGGIYGLLARKADQEEIAKWLEEMSATHLGVPSDLEECRSAAVKLLTINVELT
jgi:hypothetical protein